jgi:hypothetical protein
MRELNLAGTELASALGFSPQYTQTEVKVLCRGNDKESGQIVLVLELRVQKRSQPIVPQNQPSMKVRKKGTKGPGNPMTPHKSLLQSIVD